MQLNSPASHLNDMVKQTRQHHISLSSMADVKANMLLTISSVVATLSVSQLSNLTYRPALSVLMFFCLVTIFLACLVVMPNLREAKRPDSYFELDNPKFNPLFFGDFHAMAFEKYFSIMEQVINDVSLCYEVELRDIYGLGQYLVNKKFRILRYGYLSFLTGFGSATGILIATLMAPGP
ncbi:MAG: hypothetical protein ACI9D8_001367 [Reinekea sp.]|jgi:hypothetical protein